MSDDLNWLSSLGDDDDDENFFDESVEGVPDWLSDLGEDAEPDPGSQSESTHPSDQKTVPLDEWLKDLSGEDDKTVPLQDVPGFDDLFGDDDVPFDQDDPAEQVGEDATGGFKVVENLPPTAGGSTESPDWLGKLNTGTLNPDDVDDSSEPESDLFSGEMDLDDLVELAPVGESEPAPVATGNTDWLKNLGQVAETQEEADADEVPAASVESWLTDLDETPPAADAEPAAELPDWMTAQEDAVEAESPPATESTGNTGWLEGFSEDTEAASTPAYPASAATGNTGWLKDIVDQAGGQEEQAPPEPEEQGESPDWLSDFGGVGERTLVFDEDPEPAPAASPVETPATDAQADLPDWLGEVSDAAEETLLFEEADDESPGAEAGAEPEAEIPDWLQNFSADSESESEPEPAAEPAEPMPDWLASAEVEADERETSAAPADEMPDWLAATEPAEPAISAEPTEAEEEVPDWLSSFADEVGDAAEQSTPDFLKEAKAEQAKSGQDNWMAGFADEDEGVNFDDSWIEDVPGDFSEKTQPRSEEQVAALGGLTPEWLGDLEDADNPVLDLSDDDSQMLDFGFVAPIEEKPAEPTFTGPVDWSQEMEEPARDLMGGDEPIEPGSEDEHGDGELPEWLQAMRPDEQSVPGIMEASEYEGGEVERGGPLAGLRGLLRAEPSVGQAISQSMVSDKLTVTEAQQTSAEVLRRMVEAETEPGEIRRPPIVTQQGLLRALFAVLLILAVLFGLNTDGNSLNRDVELSVDTNILFQKMETLSDGARVLVSFDYEPGRSAELDAAAAGVLDKLMMDGNRLAIVSTSPIGPAIGVNAITNIHQIWAYEYGTQYVNLGYISGGAVGLQSFAKFPKETISLGYDDVFITELLASSQPWAEEMMGGVNVVQDFEMVVVITDNADTARNWVEQVEPEIKAGGFVMIASAQIEPMVRPFYEIQPAKIDALVTSIDEGAAIEKMVRLNLSNRYWNAYGAGLLVAIGLMVGLGGYNIYMGVMHDDEPGKKRRRP